MSNHFQKQDINDTTKYINECIQKEFNIIDNLLNSYNDVEHANILYAFINIIEGLLNTNPLEQIECIIKYIYKFNKKNESYYNELINTKLINLYKTSCYILCNKFTIYYNKTNNPIKDTYTQDYYKSIKNYYDHNINTCMIFNKDKFKLSKCKNTFIQHIYANP